MKKIVLLCAVLFLWTNLVAQDLYMPRNVKNAFSRGTRSMDGKPGPKYWQNTADYNIKINVAPKTRLVTGTEDIVYKNNSPVPMQNPVIRLTMNIHRPGGAREYPASEDYLSTGMIIDEFKENGKIGVWKDTTTTFKSVKLSAPIKSGESVKLSFKWHFVLSKESGREGAIDPTSFFLAYFYPRVAVFDDIDGWDRTQFTDSHEFYNDFNNYVFEVAAPKNFIVWATGDLQNVDEVLQPKFAARLKESFTSDKIINVATFAELRGKSVTAQTPTVNWKWKASNISDVAIGISDHYIWDAGSVIVDNSTKRRASVQAAYNVEAKDFQKMVEYGKHALNWSSNNYPGIPYPFSKSTIFRGFAGMEYPMMANDESYEDPVFSRFVAEHEILHTWFPFYMGINERRYGFMDEGWTTAFENLIATDDMGKEAADKFFKQFRVQGWARDPSASSDIPIITPGDSLVGSAIGANQYGKPAVAYLALKDLLGDEMFKKCLHEFMNRWNGKHPLPWDMFNTFNDVSGKDLNWFFQSWFFSNGYIDFEIEKVTSSEKGYSIGVKNLGGFPAPIDVVVEFKDGSTRRMHIFPQTWSRNHYLTLNINTEKKVKSIVLDGGIYMDADESNNSWKAN